MNYISSDRIIVIKNGPSKNVGLAKFWPDLEIS